MTGRRVLGFALLLEACSSAPRPVERAAAGWSDASPHRVTMVTVAPGVRVEVLDWGGTGPPLVFLSGLQDVAHGFDEFAPRFTDRFHVLAVTRRGYGASSQPAGGYDIATRVADLRAALDRLGLARMALVGHSMAGDELTAFAAAYPERVSRLVYLDAAYDHSGLDTLLWDAAPPQPMLRADSASPAAVQAYLLRTYGVRIPEAQLRAIARYGADQRLESNVTPDSIDRLMLRGCGHPRYTDVRTPALAIYAVHDSAPDLFPNWPVMDPPARRAARRFTATLQAWAASERARFRRGIPGARVLELHGANHYVFFSHEAVVTEAMRTFLGEGP